MNKNYPGRITSAPLTQQARGMSLRTSASPSFLDRAQSGSTGTGASAQQSHHHGTLPRAPRAKPTTSVQAPAPAPPPPKEEMEEERSDAAEAASSEVSYPEDRVYNVEDFIKLRRCQTQVPREVMEYARAMWKEMPENMDDMENNSLRDNLFREQNASTMSKVMTDRRINNEVLGILGKVTASNLEKMKKELTDLPIRQSTKEEIDEVIKVFFNKSTKPEDSCYTNLYVQLIAHLISSIGEREEAGRMIRNEVLRQCRSTFMNSGADAVELEKRMATMSPEDAEMERIQFSGKQKANIQFLGLMFKSRLVRQKVVHAVLDSLLYGPGHRRHIPTDYSLIHFMELLQVCGPHLDAAFYEDPLPRYRETITELSISHPQKRIQFLLQNFLETMNNNWVPLHGPGARRTEGGGNAAQNSTNNNGAGALANTNGRGGNVSAMPPVPVPAQEAQPRVPDYEEFSKVMDDFFMSSSVDEIVSIMSSIPPEVVVVYCAKWLGRYINTYKYTAERTRLGELFETLMKKGALTMGQAQEALLQHVQKSAEEELFADIPKYFVHWASLIRHGHSVFPYSLHTKVLNMLVDNHVSIEVIANMVRDVEADTKPDQLKDLKPQDRFRVLQALLRYTPPMFAHDSDDDQQQKLTVLDVVGTIDPEVTYFNELCTSYDDDNFHASPALSDMQKHSPFLCASAFFTFVRYDVNFLCSQYKELLRRIFTARPADTLLVEVYLQWRSLGCSHRFLFAFIRKVLDVVNNRLDVLNKLAAQLRTTFKEDMLVSLMEDAIKERK
ncbi:putative MIF4G domain containing protein [Leishmania utingensis]|uniref:MIF4G domain containing protein n=1 Tax=Leishmania utingensis TaxID=653362 RepID=A0AAW3AW02_9TRYP